MGLKNYGRNQKKRKEYIHQSGLLLAGVDVSKAKHDVCIGSLEGARLSRFRSPIISTYNDPNLGNKGIFDEAGCVEGSFLDDPQSAG